MVPIARQLGRPQLQEESDQDSDFLDPNADLHLKPRVPTVHMSAHPDRWIEARSPSDGPDVGAYDVDRPIGVDAPAVDFALARGRDLATRVRKRLEGDRLILDIDAGWDAVKPSIPAVSINPLPSEAPNREVPLPEVGFYEPDLTLTKRRLLDVVNMRRMQARQQEDGDRRLPDGERLAAGLGEYPLSDGAIRATIQVPGFGRFKGHVAGVPRSAEGDQLDLDLADGFVRPHHWTVSDMERMVGRREAPRDRFTVSLFAAPFFCDCRAFLSALRTCANTCLGVFMMDDALRKLSWLLESFSLHITLYLAMPLISGRYLLRI